MHGHWVHSHEEDTGDAIVLRRATHPFPPSRGRTSFELHPDGSYVEMSPGPVDAPEASTGSWSLEGDRLVMGADGDGSGHVWNVVDIADDRLVVRD